jgi:hypothetical protein
MIRFQANYITLKTTNYLPATTKLRQFSTLPQLTAKNFINSKRFCEFAKKYSQLTIFTFKTKNSQLTNFLFQNKKLHFVAFFFQNKKVYILLQFFFQKNISLFLHFSFKTEQISSLQKTTNF